MCSSCRRRHLWQRFKCRNDTLVEINADENWNCGNSSESLVRHSLGSFESEKKIAITRCSSRRWLRSCAWISREIIERKMLQNLSENRKHEFEKCSMNLVEFGGGNRRVHGELLVIIKKFGFNLQINSTRKIWRWNKKEVFYELIIVIQKLQSNHWERR